MREKPTEPVKSVDNRDQAFRAITGESQFADSLNELRVKMFAHLDSLVDLADLPPIVRQQLAQTLNGAAIVEEALSGIASRVVEVEENLGKIGRNLSSIVQNSKRDIAARALKHGTVSELLYELGEVRHIVDMSALLMQESFRHHSSIATVAYDSAAIERELSVTANELSSSSFNGGTSTFDLTNSWVYSEKKIPVNIELLNELITTVAREMIPRCSAAGIHPALDVFLKVHSDEDLAPVRSFLQTQSVGIFPVLHGSALLGGMVNLLDREVFTTIVNRHPELELAGLAAVSAQAIARVMRIPEE